MNSKQNKKQLTVSQYADLRGVTVTYVNRLLREADNLEATAAIMVRAHSKTVTQARYQARRTALVGVVDWQWLGRQRVLTVNLQQLQAFECRVCNGVFSLKDDGFKGNRCYNCWVRR